MLCELPALLFKFRFLFEFQNIRCYFLGFIIHILVYPESSFPQDLPSSCNSVIVTLKLWLCTSLGPVLPQVFPSHCSRLPVCPVRFSHCLRLPLKTVFTLTSLSVVVSTLSWKLIVFSHTKKQLHFVQHDLFSHRKTELHVSLMTSTFNSNSNYCYEQ